MSCTFLRITANLEIRNKDNRTPLCHLLLLGRLKVATAILFLRYWFTEQKRSGSNSFGGVYGPAKHFAALVRLLLVLCTRHSRSLNCNSPGLRLPWFKPTQVREVELLTERIDKLLQSMRRQRRMRLMSPIAAMMQSSSKLPCLSVRLTFVCLICPIQYPFCIITDRELPNR